jgi:hypothetical protein
VYRLIFCHVIAVLVAFWSTCTYGLLPPGDYRVVPSVPTTSSHITIDVLQCYDVIPVNGGATFPAPGKIRVSYYIFACSGGGSYFSQTHIGPLPPGDYDVEIYYYYNPNNPNEVGSLQGALSFTVIPASTEGSVPTNNVNDMWWIPSESGWGMSIIQHANGKLFSVWFTYGSDGKPTWYVIPGGAWVTPARWVGTMYRTTGPPLYGRFDPAAVTVTMVGGASIEFSNSDAAVFQYAINGFGGTRNVRRQEY